MGRLRIAYQGLIQELTLVGGSRPLRLLSKATLTKKMQLSVLVGVVSPPVGLGQILPKILFLSYTGL